jgi:hypothetical protein
LAAAFHPLLKTRLINLHQQQILSPAGITTAQVRHLLSCRVCEVLQRYTPAEKAVRLLQMLLQSPHRTLDPEEADFFYVPAYTSCFMWPVHGWADYPWWYSDGG